MKACIIVNENTKKYGQHFMDVSEIYCIAYSFCTIFDKKMGLREKADAVLSAIQDFRVKL